MNIEKLKLLDQRKAYSYQQLCQALDQPILNKTEKYTQMTEWNKVFKFHTHKDNYYFVDYVFPYPLGENVNLNKLAYVYSCSMNKYIYVGIGRNFWYETAINNATQILKDRMMIMGLSSFCCDFKVLYMSPNNNNDYDVLKSECLKHIAELQKEGFIVINNFTEQQIKFKAIIIEEKHFNNAKDLLTQNNILHFEV